MGEIGKQGNVKQKPFRQIYIQAYSGIIQAYSEPCVTLAHSEFWYIQNFGLFKTRSRYIFRTPGISKTLTHSEPQTHSESWDILNRRHTQNFAKNLRWGALRNS